MGFLLMLLEFPLPLFPPFLQYDASGLPSILAALAIGPGAGATVELVKSLLYLLSGKSTTGLLGPAAAFLAGTAMAEVAGWAYRRWAGRGRLVAALGIANLAAAALMALANYYVFLPLYGVPAGQAAGMAVKVILPFNLVKGVLTALIVLAVTLRFPPSSLER
jgi:riboflavin transporter FmnP